MEIIMRAEDIFESPRYLFLTRHPYSVIESIVRIRLDKLFGPGIYGTTDADPFVVAEKVWIMCYRNLLEFSRKIGGERCHFIRYEDLVVDPRNILSGVCQFLEIPFDEKVLHPYDNSSGKMITGIGDPNIMNHDGIDPRLGEVWKKIKLPYVLSKEARSLARELNYELPAESALFKPAGSQ
jgi:phthiocerol/phenolphthiocerol synthesis type-I polyketide synthase E